MEINNILTFVGVAALLVMSPGPNGFLITKTVPISGCGAGFANIWGFVAAMYVHGTLSIFGISILLVQSAQAFFIFKMLGAIYLVWIGLKSLISAFKQAVPPALDAGQKAVKRVSIRGAYIEGFLTNALNPKVSMFYLAAFPQFISVDDSALSAYLLVTAHSLVNFLWFSVMVFMLSRIKTVANNSLFKRTLNLVTGVVFIVFGSKLALMKNN